jgi:hypothetical protein
MGCLTEYESRYGNSHALIYTYLTGLVSTAATSHTKPLANLCTTDCNVHLGIVSAKRLGLSDEEILFFVGLFRAGRSVEKTHYFYKTIEPLIGPI